MKKFKYTLEQFRWLKALNSPFRPFHIKWYVGKTQIGTPYFLPRKWVKATPERATKAALEQIESSKKWNERNPDSKFKHTIKSFEEVYEEKMHCSFPVPLKVGFSYCGLGWKIKWSSTDFRYEWGPVLSFVFFGYQIAAMVGYKDASHYWEAWLYYEYATDKTKSNRERIEQCRKEFNQTWTRHISGANSVTIDYYQLILKSKYLK